MTAHLNRLASILTFGGVVCVFATTAAGQWGSGSNSPAYTDYRQSLLADGWKPDVRYGLKTASGKALYKFPEIVCGPTLCNAKWRDRQGHEKLIRLIRGHDGQDHRVAPQ